MRQAFLTFFFVGKIPIAPGTFGSLAAAVVGYFLLIFLGEIIGADGARSVLCTLSLAVALVAIFEVNKDEAAGAKHDRSEIVIDEVAGMWLAMSFSWSFAGDGLSAAILAFIFFRIYDIWKPSVVGKIDREVKGGLGVVGDDVLAGALAGLSVLMVYGAASKLGYAQFLAW